jgi:ribosomal protein S18 acetylase RimI-like enzyme
MTEITVRAATLEDAPGMARVHVTAWQETYRGQVPDDELDAPDFVERRERMWNRALADSTRPLQIAVAEAGGDIVGIAMAGPAEGDDAPRDWQLYVLYLLKGHHGSGAGQRLIDAVLQGKASVLWVADPNPRAQAFYRRNGFLPDGAAQGEAPREIRMVRGTA